MPDAENAAVDPAWIKAQRAAGWPDMHPEDYCHRCGAPNPNWWTDRDTWLGATSAWAAETGREGVCCPRCLIQMHEEATGRPSQWRLSRVFSPGATACERCLRLGCQGECARPLPPAEEHPR